ncbi:16788_t:CDS:2, partial [Gigaspora margarita]
MPSMHILLYFIRKLLENIEFQFVLAENEVQFEEKLKNFLSHVLKQLASPHEIVRKKDKITHLLSLIKNIELKSHNLKNNLFQITLE